MLVASEMRFVVSTQRRIVICLLVIALQWFVTISKAQTTVAPSLAPTPAEGGMTSSPTSTAMMMDAVTVSPTIVSAGMMMATTSSPTVTMRPTMRPTTMGSMTAKPTMKPTMRTSTMMPVPTMQPITADEVEYRFFKMCVKRTKYECSCGQFERKGNKCTHKVVDQDCRTPRQPRYERLFRQLVEGEFKVHCDKILKEEAKEEDEETKRQKKKDRKKAAEFGSLFGG